jgi:Zn-dependent protease
MHLTIKMINRRLWGITFATSLIMIFLLASACVYAAGVQTQLCLVIDGSGSIDSGEWDIIRQAIATAINETMPHDGSVELTIVQFGYSSSDGYAKTELKPTIIDASNYAAISAQILTIPKGDGSTPTAHGLFLGWSEMQNSSNFNSNARQVINLATDGVPNISSDTATIDLDGSGGSANAEDDVIAVVNNAVAQGLDELDVEAIGITQANSDWLQSWVVRPQPGVIAPPFTKAGWIRIVADPTEFANTIGQKIGVIVFGNEGAWVPSAEGTLAAGLTTIGITSLISAFASALSSPTSLPSSTIASKISQLFPEILKKWLHEFISSKRKRAISQKTGNPLKPTKPEIITYIIASAILTIAYAYAKTSTFNEILSVIPSILLTSVIVGFAKNFLEVVIARKLGVWTEHRLWYFGLASFILSTIIFKVPFSSPSRNTSYSPEFTKRKLGMVSASSVLIGIVFALIFYIIFASGFTLIGSIGIVMSLSIAFFEALPIPPMNGKDIYNWNKILWVILFELTLVLYILCLFFI